MKNGDLNHAYVTNYQRVVGAGWEMEWSVVVSHFISEILGGFLEEDL